MANASKTFQSYTSAASLACVLASLTLTNGNACDTTSIVRELPTAMLNGYRVKSVAAEFTPATILIALPNGHLQPKDIIQPTIALRLDASFYPAWILDQVRTIVSSSPFPELHPDDAYLSGTSFASGVAHAHGGLTLTKWISMDGFKCHWEKTWYGGYLKCEHTVWKTKLFEKTFPWDSSTALALRIVQPTSSLPAPELPVYSRTLYDTVTDSDLDTDGEVNFHISNDLERLIIDVFYWFEGALHGKFDHYNLSNRIPNLRQNEARALDARQYLYPTEGTSIYRDNTKFVGREGYRGLWQIFVDTLFFDQRNSGFGIENGGPILALRYIQDNDRFAKRLGENRRRGDTKVIGDPFLASVFCTTPTDGSPSTRDKISEFMDDVARRLEGKNTDQPFTGSLKEVGRSARNKYGTSRVVSFLERSGFIRLDGRVLSGVLPSFAKLEQLSGLVLPWESASSYSHYFSLSRKERKCALALLARRHGSSAIALPLEDISVCMVDAGLSTEQLGILEQIQRERAGLVNDRSGKAFAAISDGIEYAGWAYCGPMARPCVGASNAIWSPELSKFGARDGRQTGIDVIGGLLYGAMPIYALTDGHVWYSNRDRAQWGNALILPFEMAGDTYYAVYSQLPESAKSFDGLDIKSGESLGVAGCSGAGGDGASHCEESCYWAGAFRSDKHLHFELLKYESGFVRIDPASILPQPVTYDDRKFTVFCDKR